MIEYLFCAIRNLGRKKLRSFLTVAGIAIGVASVIVVGAIGEGGKAAVSQQLDSLGINGLNISARNDDSGTGTCVLDDYDVRACMSVKGVKSAMPMIMQMGTASVHGLERDALYWGIGEDAGDTISIKLEHGHMFTHSDIGSHASVCLVDDTFAKAMYKRTNIVGKTIDVEMGGQTRQLVIRGIVSAGSSLLNNIVGNYMPSFIYLPYTTAEDLRGRNGYDQIAVQAAPGKNLDIIGRNITAVMSVVDGSKVFTASNMNRQKERLSNLMTIVTLIISAVGAISMVVAGLGVMTVMTVSVNERTKEIGIKKAIGARKGIIMLEFLFEALLISLIGGAAGILAGGAISFLCALCMKFVFAVKLKSILLSTGFAVITGVLFGVYPAVKAARMKPVDALRRE